MTDYILGMASQYPGRRRPDAMEGLEASRRVGFAMFYQELERANALSIANHQMRERIDVLLQALLDLVNAVLSARNVDAFAMALRIANLIREFEDQHYRDEDQSNGDA